MLIIDTRDSDSIDKALKKYKKKYEKAGILRELRDRQTFTKRSVNRKAGIRNAIYYSLSIIGIFTLLGFLITLIFGQGALNNMASRVKIPIMDKE